MEEELIQKENEIQKQLDRTRREMALLYDISNAMRTTLELNHILYIILTCVTSHTGLGFNRAILFLINKKKQTIEGKMVIGPESGEEANRIWTYIESENPNLDDLIAAYKIYEAEPLSPLRQKVKYFQVPLNLQEGGLLAKAYFEGNPIHVPKTEIQEHSNDPLLKNFHTNELIIMPLKAKDKVNGLIVADNLFTQKPISPDDLKTFTMLSNQAGLAIENSQLYEIVVNKSRMDSLTNLWNHGFFQDTLTKEIEYAKERKWPLSLIIMDLDNFKQLNDTYGHQKGDLILMELAKLLKESSRETDYVCRYGGEEFSILLTATNRDQAYAIAERLRIQIAERAFPVSEQQTIKLTVSIGIATFPDDTTSKEELIGKADKAMYTAKFIGKNKTCLAEPD